MAINKDDLAEKSGEIYTTTPPKVSYPFVRLHGKEGFFERTIIDEDGKAEKQDIGKEFEGVILKIRRVLSQYTPKEKLFSNEHNSWRDKVILFQSTQAGNRMKIDEGTPQELRSRHPLLRLNQYLYVLTAIASGVDVVAKLRVKGASLASLFSYYEEFKKETGKPKEHIFEYETKITPYAEENELGKYFVMKFEKGKKVKDLQMVADKIEEIVGIIRNQEEYYGRIEKIETKEDEGEEEKDINPDEIFPEEKGKMRETLDKEEKDAVKDL